MSDDIDTQADTRRLTPAIKIDAFERGIPLTIASDLAHLAGALRSNGNERSARSVDEAKAHIETLEREKAAAFEAMELMQQALRVIEDGTQAWQARCAREYLIRAEARLLAGLHTANA